MVAWYRTIVSDLSKLPDCMQYYEDEILNAKSDLSMRGKSIEKLSAEMPGVVEVRFNQLQELEAILEYLNVQYRKERTIVFRKFLEAYQRELSSRDAERFVDGEPHIVDYAILVNEFALVRNKFLGVLKGLDQKSWMLGHVTKLRCAGLDDATVV